VTAMNVVFRVDASIQMGTGHVMRCLTLAKELYQQGAECSFMCRNHAGNLIEKIAQAGFKVYTLGADENNNSAELSINEQNQCKQRQPLFHADWLGTTQWQDITECLGILQKLQPDWLIVDHYALDKRWEQRLQPYYNKLMVIDDLGDREHLADILLDQNYGATTAKYQGLVPNSCTVLAGTQFALLRDEFAQWRAYSLERRGNSFDHNKKPERKGSSVINNILITLGGADPENYTGALLAQLARIKMSPHVVITVVMGATAPHLQAIQQQAASMPVRTIAKTNVGNMAELMSHADLAIGAAGATTWERCCLGLPTIQIVTAENQRRIAEDLAKDNIIKLLNDVSELPEVLKDIESWITPLANSAKHVTDGLGVKRVVDYMLQGYQL